MIFDELRALSSDLPHAASTSLPERFENPYTTIYPGVPLGQRRPLEHEIYEWRRQFIGKPALHFLHAATIIALRRNEDTATHLENFNRMWRDQGIFLSTTLNAKWLVSACDTIMDFAADEKEGAIAAIGAGMIKIIKMYETEQYLGGGLVRPVSAENYAPKELFDGFFTFNIGFGDVMVNYKQRLEQLTSTRTPAGMITLELFNRISERYDTAVSRMRAHHTYPDTAW